VKNNIAERLRVPDQLAPHRPCSTRLIDTADGGYDLLVTPVHPPSNRYQPYPQPQILPTGELLVLGQRDSTRHYKLQHQLVDPQIDGRMVQPPAPANAPHPEYDVDVMTADDLILAPMTDYDVEMEEASYAPEVNFTDVEMEDDCLLLIPTIVVTPPDDSGQELFVLG